MTDRTGFSIALVLSWPKVMRRSTRHAATSELGFVKTFGLARLIVP